MPIQVTDNTGSPKQGKKIDAATMPTGGKGVIGWLSAIWYKLTQGLTVTGTGGVFPVTDNSGSLTVDAPVGTPIFVRLSDGSSAIATLPVSIASVPSHAVTNIGTFAVQVDGNALTSLQLIDDTITSQGTSLGTTKTSLIGGSVTTSAPSYTNGQIQPLSLTTNGALRVDSSATTQTVTSSPGTNREFSTSFSSSGSYKFDCSDCEIVVISLQGASTFIAEISFQVAIEDSALLYTTAPIYDGSISQPLSYVSLSGSPGGGPYVHYKVICAGYKYCKIICNNYVSGNATVQLSCTRRTDMTLIDNMGAKRLNVSLPYSTSMSTILDVALFSSTGQSINQLNNSLLTTLKDDSGNIISTSYPLSTQTLNHNGSSFDQQTNNVIGIALTSAARTADIGVDLVNYNCRGIIVTLDVTAITATPSITLRIQSKDPASGKYENLNAVPTAVTAVGTHTYILYPSADITEVGDSVQTTCVPLPRNFRIFIDHLDADSITYSVGYQLIL